MLPAPEAAPEPALAPALEATPESTPTTAVPISPARSDGSAYYTALEGFTFSDADSDSESTSSRRAHTGHSTVFGE